MTGVRRLAWFYLAALAVGCGGESTRPSSPNGCATGSCPDTGGSGGNGSTAAAEGGGGSAGRHCTGAELLADPARLWANWSMPHPPSSDLPNPAEYDSGQPGVVIDGVTGLMWARDASPIAEELTVEDALNYCAESEAGGYCDWRLPTRIELVSLVDFTRGAPAIDLDVFSDFPDASEQRVGWSFYTASVNETTEWRVMFLDGASVAIQRGSAVQGARARCVRLHVDSSPPESRYLVDGQAPDDIVTDRGTDLTWQRSPSEQTFPFSEARAYCASLELHGGGWRLPSMKELQTIVDENRPSPAVDPEVFGEFPQGGAADAFFRSSSLSAECSDCAWLMRPDGSVFETGVNAGIDDDHYVRCVR